MGDDLETYRLRIGCHSSGGLVKRKNKHMTCQNAMFVSLLTSICLLSVLAVTIALCGDIETNPGPHTSKKYCAACHRCSAERNTSYFSFPSDRLALIDTNHGHLLLKIRMCA